MQFLSIVSFLSFWTCSECSSGHSHVLVKPLVYSFIYSHLSFINLFASSFIYLFIYLFICIYLFIYLFIYSCIYLFIYLFCFYLGGAKREGGVGRMQSGNLKYEKAWRGILAWNIILFEYCSNGIFWTKSDLWIRI